MPDADYTAELQRMMTHQPEGPNPAQPYIGALRGFLQPPDLRPEHLAGTSPADYLRELYRNPDLRARAVEQAMPFAMMGSTTPKGGMKITDNGLKIHIQPSDMKIPEWGRGLNWGLTAYRTKQGPIQVRDARLPEEYQGQGHGTAMYERLADKAAKEKVPLHSDSTVTESAANRWMALNRLGHDVQMHPDKKYVSGPPEAPHLGRFETPDGSPVFRIEPVKSK